jgi:hypothetical protein
VTTFLRVLEADDKAAALLAAIHAPQAAQGKQHFEVDPASFASVPRRPDVCRQCGEAFLMAATLKEIDQIVSEGRPKKHASVAVFELKPRAA